MTTNPPNVVDWSYSGFLFRTGLPVFVDHSIRSEFFKAGAPEEIEIIQGKISKMFGMAPTGWARIKYKTLSRDFRYRIQDGMYWIG